MTDPSPIVLTSADLTVSVVPATGARIAQITDATGRDWLVQTDRPEPGTDQPIPFTAGTRGGWDECLPSIAECADPNPGRSGEPIRDHGDFWSRPWRTARASASEIVLDRRDPNHPLQLRKSIRLLPGRAALEVRIDVSNAGPRDYRFLYSAHPLWSWPEAAVIVIPQAGQVVSAFGPRWPQPVVGTWPSLGPSGGTFDLAEVARTGPSENYKVFVRWAGVARLEFPDLGAAVTMRQSTDSAPWVGLCVNRDSWPEQGAGASWIAIEPANAPSDSLVDAWRQGSAHLLQPGRSMSFTNEVEITPEPGRPRS
ncbi:aldose 1-epimerase family protein [Occultella gossypii]|uniref:Galactose mutarotase n=1 Tax=Occultella gossypii TaxID=2800820 RepID=A0ABS7SHV8_9MICO|nr:aldose 1-epimerase family protein [Occultella gossypii]MBZ2199745.1 hypothetical protein [Occultella gossypii]